MPAAQQESAGDDDHEQQNYDNVENNHTSGAYAKLVVRRPRTPQPPDIQIQSPTQHNVNAPANRHELPLDLPSPMNLHQLGITPLSPLRPQFTRSLSTKSLSPRSSPARTSNGTSNLLFQKEEDGYEADDGMDSDDSNLSTTADDVTQDSRDVLVERLTDLAQRLAQSGTNVRTENISTLHAQVDEMEKVLSRRDVARRAGSRRSSRGPRPHSLRHVSSESQLGGTQKTPLGIIMSPSWLMQRFYGGDSAPTSPLMPKDKKENANPFSSIPEQLGTKTNGQAGSPPKISSEMADRIVQEAEKLCAEMQQLVENLQARREESDHIHALSVVREGAAAKLIADLESRIEDFEDETAENESELRYLRLQLRAIEVECHQYVPRDADPKLAQSIRNWKEDWARLREKWASRSGSSFGDDSTFSTLASPPAR